MRLFFCPFHSCQELNVDSRWFLASCLLFGSTSLKFSPHFRHFPAVCDWCSGPSAGEWPEVGLPSNQSLPPLGSLGLTERPPAGTSHSKTKQETSRLWVSGEGRQQEGRRSARKTWWEIISHPAVSQFCLVNSLFLEQPHNCQLENPRVHRAEQVQPTDYVEWQKDVMQSLKTSSYFF